ncbi:hypothetical protein HF325_002753 [Metschnikowia pulcherrima]|uniref:Mitochondrial import inner membrane translocase subunit TIM54 n=1 Tax=Metschnikowia pulcherrima TaxID=27326 RepID=A0A8H7LD61_9ASCO|nr:hypothetical protein HF325_002753 [Metschnikowia pulcherrima]
MRHFRRYIKPILNAAAIDFEVYTENRQGDIRAQVAEKVRQLRRDQIAKQAADEAKQAQIAYEKSWSKFWRESVPLVLKEFKKTEQEPEKYVSRQDLYTPMDVLGLYRIIEPVSPARDHGDDALLCGGVVCIGRGAYKDAKTDTETEKKAPEVADFAEKEGEGQKKQDPVPKPYILPSDYAQGELAPELDFEQVIRNNKNAPVIFEQPLYVFPVPKLSGFLNMPRKIYRYFTTSEMAEEVSENTMCVVNGNSRPFEFKDKFLGKEEEVDWPKKWVERGKAKNSEWVQELEVDERVTSRMKVFDSGK